ncbi:hypothetical protein HMPREF3036_02523 [Sutterella sp. KLE1602]|nr:hypothetical protein HMPREF3036_02523 [Sutterella sp. KLE1602]
MKLFCCDTSPALPILQRMVALGPSRNAPLNEHSFSFCAFR